MYFKRFTSLNWFTSGLRLWSNRIPLRFDSYSGSCSNFCSYCYARQVSQGGLARQGIKYDPQTIKVGNLNAIAKACNTIFNENKYDSRSYQHYWLLHRGLIENGTMSDPFLKEEATMLNTYNLLQLANGYKLPLYFNTKGNALINSEKHFDAVCELNKNGGTLFDVSLTSNNDKLIKKFEPKAPLPSERLELIKRMTENNVDVIASARPIIKGVTDFDYENYIGELCDAGVKSIHLRTLIISGKQLKSEFWKKYAKEQGMIFKNISYRYDLPYFMDLFERAMDVAKPKGVGVTASHTLFFKFGTANKCDYSKVSQKIQDSLFEPGIETILHNTYRHKKKPQMLYYDEILKPHIKRNPEFMKHRFLMDDKTSTLIWSSSCTMKVRIKFLLDGKTITKNSMWNGWERNASCDGKKQMLRSGYIASINDIYTVVDKKGEQLLDEKDNLIYAYIPEEYKERTDIKSTHTRKSDVITVKDLKEVGLSI